MMQLLSGFLRRLRREDGQGMVEYALIIFLVAIAAAAVVGLLGTKIVDVFNNITSSL